MPTRIAPAVLLAMLACTVMPEEEDGEDLLDESYLNAATGDQPNLCERLIEIRASLGQAAVLGGVSYRVFQGDENPNTLNGTSGPDLIFGGDGEDTIRGGSSQDIICAGAGADFVDGGPGQDRIYGGAGDDILHGAMAGDWVHGDGDRDIVFGDLLDDKLYGDDGDDLIVGGHGVDHMEGGAGNDWLRGDTNADDFLGGAGYDVASFATARPTGRSNRGALIVMAVDLAGGTAIGDGYDELLQGIEKVVGSPFDDDLSGPGDLSGGYGNDLCDGAACGGGQVSLPFAYVDARRHDTGVVVLGSAGGDRLIMSRAGTAVTVRSEDGAAITAGPGCAATGAGVVTCKPKFPLRYLLAWGGDGDDQLTVAGGFPRDFEAHLDGGDGDDQLTGGGGSELLYGGRSGADFLQGGGGDDALISESYDDDKARYGIDYGGGADVLLGQDGNDQLVCDYPCGGHHYSGGPGLDIAGFARVGERSIHAQLNGPIHAGDRSDFFGRSFLPDVCNVDLFGTTLDDDLEILEGSKGDDKLLGNDRDNIIWGRQGNDLLRGFGGSDVLEGHEGSDQIYGGDGDDKERP